MAAAIDGVKAERAVNEERSVEQRLADGRAPGPSRTTLIASIVGTRRMPQAWFRKCTVAKLNRIRPVVRRVVRSNGG